MNIVSVVKDGEVTYYATGGNEMRVFARIMVPADFSVESTAQLGMNVMGATWGSRPVGEDAAPIPLPAGHARNPTQVEHAVGVREQLYRAVLKDPGYPSTYYGRKLDLTIGKTKYHMELLRDAGRLLMHGERAHARWYPSNN